MFTITTANMSSPLRSIGPRPDVQLLILRKNRERRIKGSLSPYGRRSQRQRSRASFLVRDLRAAKALKTRSAKPNSQSASLSSRPLQKERRLPSPRGDQRTARSSFSTSDVATQYEIPFKLSISTFHASVMAITPVIANHKVRHPLW